MILTSGCVNLQELTREIIEARKAGQQGMEKVYPVTTYQACFITKSVFRWEKTDELAVHPEENYIITSTGMKMAAFGSVMGVWIEPVDSEHTKINVLTRRRVEWDLFTRLTAVKFYQRFQQGVTIVKSGKPLPEFPP
jgi:hypothetical protein